MYNKELNVAKANSEVWDRWVDEGDIWSIPISHEIFINAQKGDWQVYLTPSKPVPKEWFIPMDGAKILGLASGGGQMRVGFTMVDLYEDYHNEGELAEYTPTYIATKAIKY